MVYKGKVFEDEVADGDVAAFENITTTYDFATNGYTQVSGLFYTGDGDQASDTVSITVRDKDAAFDAPDLATGSVSITVTQLPDSPEVSGPVTLSMIDEDQTTLITQTKLLEKATDPDTAFADLTVQNLTVDGGASKGMVTSVTAYDDVGAGATAPAGATTLTLQDADVARVAGTQGKLN